MRASKGFVLVLLACLLILGAQAQAVGLYASDYGGHLYKVQTEAFSVADLGQIYGPNQTPFNKVMAMDYDPTGTLHITRLGMPGWTGYMYVLDPTTVGKPNVINVTQELPALGTALGGGLTFRNDGKFYALTEFDSVEEKTYLVVGDLSQVDVSKLASAARFRVLGLEWYDDGSSDGLLLALNSRGKGVSLDVAAVNGDKISFSTFALNPTGGDARYGDLAIDGSTLFVAAAGKLWSYDLKQGAGGNYLFLGLLPDDINGLAAIPGEGIVLPVTPDVPQPPAPTHLPEPLTMFGMMIGVGGVMNYLRKRKQ